MTSDPAAASASLRALALSRTPEEIGYVPTASGPKVFGVLMETGLKAAVFTLACFFDGSTSLYFSSGGGVIGCGEREPVKAAAKVFLSVADKCAPFLPPTAAHPLPEVGHVHFYLRTPAATLILHAAESDFREKRHQLWPLYYTGNNVITVIRKLGLL